MHIGVVLKSTDYPECDLDDQQHHAFDKVEDAVDPWQNEHLKKVMRPVYERGARIFATDFINLASEVLRENIS